MAEGTSSFSNAIDYPLSETYIRNQSAIPTNNLHLNIMETLIIVLSSNYAEGLITMSLKKNAIYNQVGLLGASSL